MANDIYTTPAISIVKDWLNEMPSNLKVDNQSQSIEACEAAVAKQGYVVPYDAEQLVLVDMLVKAQAGKIACLVAWGYYHDYKVAQS